MERQIYQYVELILANELRELLVIHIVRNAPAAHMLAKALAELVVGATVRARHKETSQMSKTAPGAATASGPS